MLNQPDAQSLFENQSRLLTKRLSEPIRLDSHEPEMEKSYSKSFSLTNARNEFKIENSKSTKIEDDKKNSFKFNSRQEASFPITSESRNTFRVASIIKPQLPPKPKNNVTYRYTQNLNSDVYKDFTQNKPRSRKFNRLILLAGNRMKCKIFLFLK
jgi:hypothetical protein